jgi:hypothetical protein
VKVVKNPNPYDKGIRYYRPKPYLFISPLGSATIVEKGSTTTTTTSPSDQYVSIELQYLPDFSEEYSIHVRSGVGVADVDFTLEDGWNLTSLNQKLDSQMDENVSALADLATGIGGALARAADVPPPGEPISPAEYRWHVQASNVPLGYYEAVIGTDRDCNKRLMGWRYVGFAPFNACPTDIEGQISAQCDSGDGAIYGLVFERGVMTFRPLDPDRANLNRVPEPTGVTQVQNSNAALPELHGRVPDQK